MFYAPLPKLEIDIDFLKDLYEHDKHKMKKWEYNGVPEDYYEIVYSPKTHSFLDGIFPITPRSYQFVIIPPETRIGIHRDVYETKCKIGVKLHGNSHINFYSERSDEHLVDSYDYRYPALINVTKFHDVVNTTEEWRVTFFASFSESFDLCKADLHCFH